MEFLINFFTDYGYWAVLFVLIICGFGVPIPEDVTLVSGGVIAGLYPESINVHMMLAVSMFGVLAGDSIMYWLGRIFGTKILRFRLIRKMMTAKRLQMIRQKFDKYGNRVVFIARFLPGLRAPIYMITGITKRVNYTRFLLLDFLAAIISVPIWIYLGEFGASNLDWLHRQIRKGQLTIYIILGILVIYILWRWWKHRKALTQVTPVVKKSLIRISPIIQKFCNQIIQISKQLYAKIAPICKNLCNKIMQTIRRK